MLEKTAKLTTVKIVIDPYSREKVQDLLRSVRQDFGLPFTGPSSANRKKTMSTERWQWWAAGNGTIANSWTMMFVFRDPADAVMFSLKYS